MNERLNSLQRTIYSKGLEHKNTSPFRIFKRRKIDREISNLLLEFFLTATEGPK